MALRDTYDPALIVTPVEMEPERVRVILGIDVPLAAYAMYNIHHEAHAIVSR